MRKEKHAEVLTSLRETRKHAQAAAASTACCATSCVTADRVVTATTDVTFLENLLVRKNRFQNRITRQDYKHRVGAFSESIKTFFLKSRFKCSSVKITWKDQKVSHLIFP